MNNRIALESVKKNFGNGVILADSQGAVAIMHEIQIADAGEFELCMDSNILSYRAKLSYRVSIQRFLGEQVGLENRLGIQKVQIQPMECYFEGKRFLGDQYWLFLGICLVGLLMAGIVPLVLYGPAFCGMALCFLKRGRGERVDFEHLFKGFDYFVPGLIATLIYVAAMMVVAIPYMILIFALMALMASGKGVLMLFGGFFLVFAYIGWILLAGIASMILMFAALLIVDRKVEGPAAMKLACQGALKNFWGVLGCSVVGQLMVFVGTMLCFVPGLLAMPIYFAGHFMVYRKIFGVQKAEPVMAKPVNF